MIYIRSIAIAAFCMILSLQAAAQSTAEVEARLGNTLDSALKASGTLNAAFNAWADRINQANPLLSQNLDSVHIVANVSLTLQFIEFLKQSHTTLSTGIARFEDSMFVIANDYPPVSRQKAILEFADAYKADQNAFDRYLSIMSKLSSGVLDALMFLQHEQFQIKNSELQFQSKSDVTTYRSLMAKIDASQKELAKARIASARTTANVHEKLDVLNKNEDQPTKKKKSAKQ